MSTYAIGDIQGCYVELLALLDKIQFSANDELWLVGDIINRGPHSLTTLRFIKSLGERVKIVLGNHDIHLLAVHYGVRPTREADTLDEILAAPDRHELIHWLQQQPLLYHDATLGITMSHAGIAPQWDLPTAQRLAQEFTRAMQAPDIKPLLAEIFTDPLGSNVWDESLSGVTRLRTIVNYFTRMRFCDASGVLDLKAKGPVEAAPLHYMPWFKVPHRKMAQEDIVFGHWAMLRGETATPHVFAIDNGCAWGETLTAMRLEDKQRFWVPSQQPKP